MTRVDCVVHDHFIIDVKYCDLKAINKSTKLRSVRGCILRPLINEGTINITSFHSIGGYRPFVINTAVDGCKFSSGQRNVFLDWIYPTLKPYTNMNHSCPYEGDVMVEKFAVTKTVLPSLFPGGDYWFKASLILNAIPHSSMNATVYEN